MGTGSSRRSGCRTGSSRSLRTAGSLAPRATAGSSPTSSWATSTPTASRRSSVSPGSAAATVPIGPFGSTMTPWTSRSTSSSSTTRTAVSRTTGSRRTSACRWSARASTLTCAFTCTRMTTRTISASGRNGVSPTSTRATPRCARRTTTPCRFSPWATTSCRPGCSRRRATLRPAAMTSRRSTRT